jgi:gliding motility-associated protein GldC
MDSKSNSKYIHLEVVLDEKSMPVEIKFTADDQPDSEPVACKGMLLSLFDKKDSSTLKLDLWSKEMQLIEMDRFIFQTLKGLADTYNRATQNTELANEMQKFVSYFGEKTGIVQADKIK